MIDKVSMLRRILFATTLAALLALAYRSSAQPISSAEPNLARAGDRYLVALLKSMTSQQWKLVSSHGSKGGNSTRSSGGFDNDQLPRTLANFDGTPGCEPSTGGGCYTLGSDDNVQNIVGNMISNGFAFSRPVCDLYDVTKKIVCYLWQGGHDGSPDGSVYAFDLLDYAVQWERSNEAQGHWRVLTKSARFIPDVIAPPKGVSEGSDAYCNISAKLTRGDDTITLASPNCPNAGSPIALSKACEYGCFAGDQSHRIADYSRISGSSLSGPKVTLTCPSNDCVKESGISIVAFNNSFWPASNRDGYLMPMSVHTYFSNILIGPDALLLGGEYLWLAGGRLDGHPDHKWVVNTATGIPTQDSSSPWGGGSCPENGSFPGRANISRNGVDGYWYGFCAGGSGGALYKLSAPGNLAAVSYTQPVTMNDPAPESLIIPDPVEGGRKTALFVDLTDSASANGQFLLVSDLANCTQSHCIVYHPNFADNPKSIFDTGDPIFRCLAFDGTNVVAWSGGAQLFAIRQLDRPNNAVISVQNPVPTGDVPNLSGGWQQNCRIYDLGLAYGHAKLAITGGDVYLEKP